MRVNEVSYYPYLLITSTEFSPFPEYVSLSIEILWNPLIDKIPVFIDAKLLTNRLD